MGEIRDATITDQLAFRMTLDELEKHYLKIYTNDFYCIRDLMGTNDAWVYFR